ncbi:tetratricopeptide repeat protein [Spirochaeta thermophila]|uniref:Uncharacterized protein n=1 Tax=Winmispira thermophila (strain ATCC 49972 / DSM 6192 / RI 19.B1) TaxID=665571 RepID=E0RSR2_WINT6|nr:hypothetical protein [Spirochaeta thermophila]ADN02049.1 hypothetical protein STHERM_c11040 [Spirochaeta thermophila DSM 6192]
MKESDLRMAQKLFARRRYGDVIRLLEPLIFEYRESFTFYALLGLSCLHVGDYGGAETFLLRAHHLRPERPEIIHGLALIYLKRGDSSLAIQRWLEILEDHPHYAPARHALDMVRTCRTDDDLEDLITSPRFRKLFPRMRFQRRRLAPVLFLTSFAGILLIGGLIVFTIHGREREDALSPETRQILREIEAYNGALFSQEGEFRYVLTSREAQELLHEIQEALVAFDDNRARISINKILLSNVAPEVKKKVEGLIPHLHPPEFGTLKTRVGFAEVMKDPPLYAGVGIQWKGRISNLEVGPDAITFDFLVGYHTRRILEGIVPVEVPFPVTIDPERAYEIVGEITIDEHSPIGFLVRCHSLRWLED